MFQYRNKKPYVSPPGHFGLVDTDDESEQVSPLQMSTSKVSTSKESSSIPIRKQVHYLSDTPLSRDNTSADFLEERDSFISPISHGYATFTDAVKGVVSITKQRTHTSLKASKENHTVVNILESFVSNISQLDNKVGSIQLVL
jgi:hypothetical protein